jgi:predicted dithiol-disulfide oxidoreductase (DUF899 family)
MSGKIGAIWKLRNFVMAIADGFDGSVIHLANHDVTAVSPAPLAKL